MPFNGAGVFQRVRNWVADAAAGVKIRADFHDSEDDGFAAGLSNCITKDGQTIVTQNIPFNTKRITGLADPINDQDAVTKKHVATTIAAGGTMTGDITITKDAPGLILNDTDAAGSIIYGQHGGKNRWVMHLGNSEAETGTGNAGSAFDLVSFADDGTTGLGQALRIERNSRLGTVAGDPTLPMGIATKQYVDVADNLRFPTAGGIFTGPITTVTGNLGINGPTQQTLGIVGNVHAGITFNIPGRMYVNFGMAEDGNFYMGGLSLGPVLHKFWTTKDFTPSVLEAKIEDLQKRVEALEGKAP